MARHRPDEPPRSDISGSVVRLESVVALAHTGRTAAGRRTTSRTRARFASPRSSGLAPERWRRRCSLRAVEGAGLLEMGEASGTAMMVAAARGAHLIRHGPRAVLADWLGWPLVGGSAEALMWRFRDVFGALSDPMTTWLSARSRFSEDCLAESGAEQYVILGAGLDSFAWRHPGRVRVFEVDHPGTQTWKRSRLQALDLAAPPDLVWAPVDFETQSIADGLAIAGVGSRPTFVSWLGVTPYLSLEAIGAVLRGLPCCSLVVSYGTPESTGDGARREARELLLAFAREGGEPIVSLLSPEQLAGLLADHGFAVVEDVGCDDAEGRYGLPAVSAVNERIALAVKAR